MPRDTLEAHRDQAHLWDTILPISHDMMIPTIMAVTLLHHHQELLHLVHMTTGHLHHHQQGAHLGTITLPIILQDMLDIRLLILKGTPPPLRDLPVKQCRHQVQHHPRLTHSLHQGIQGLINTHRGCISN